jgi:hypothetical protein
MAERRTSAPTPSRAKRGLVEAAGVELDTVFRTGLILKIPTKIECLK